MTATQAPLHVSLVAVPETMISTLGGIYDVLNSFPVLAGQMPALPEAPPFRAEIVTPSDEAVLTASGLPVPGRSFDEIEHTDIIMVPSLMPAGMDWVPGRYPGLVEWIGTMGAQGAMLCSACSGVLLLAETGRLDGHAATIHPLLVPSFRRHFPAVTLKPEHVLVTAGEREEIVTSGSTTTWHDLVLYLIARLVGPSAAQSMAKFFLLQWHGDGQALYAVFVPPTDHGDAMVREAQDWLHANLTRYNPVDAVVARCGVPARTFKRRFGRATGYTPIAYVQRLRVEEAKRRLERSSEAVDEIGWAVGYEDPAFFRRLFKRLTGVSPAVYRRKLRLPDFAVAAAAE